jgi:hypothetical protein
MKLTFKEFVPGGRQDRRGRYRLFSRSSTQGPRLEIEDIDQGLFTLKAEVPGGVLVIEMSAMEMSAMVGDAFRIHGVLRDR